MATLKSIKNKYLTVSDGAALGVTTNTENVSLLSFKLASADSLSKFNLVDGFSDDYNDATGISAGDSTGETRNSSGKYYSGATEMTNLVYLSHFDEGTDGATSWTPTVGTLGTAVNGTQIDNGSAKFGTLSLRYDQSANQGAYITDSSDYDLAGNNFTIDFWVNFNGTLPTSGQCQAIGNAENWQVRFQSGGSWSRMSFVSWDTGNTEHDIYFSADPRSGLLDSTGWHHFAWVRSGSTMYFFKDGVEKGTATLDWTIRSTSSGAGGVNPYFFSDQYGDWDTNFNGYVDEIRILNGTAAWTSGFTPETSAYVAFTYKNITLASTAYTAQADPTTIRIIMDEYTAVGSATINTDIKAYASRDNGTTYTQITTLADQGTIETNHRLPSGSVDVSGQPAGSSVKYKIETLNQGASKTTRVYGTSMAWA